MSDFDLFGWEAGSPLFPRVKDMPSSIEIKDKDKDTQRVHRLQPPPPVHSEVTMSSLHRRSERAGDTEIFGAGGHGFQFP
ncbi:hypothetical protein CDV31_004724 [Fusarium ambrosium]|uniref:Uncharacterized protein n=1 Tax=Fusarium ambrosium TaxID=131363 RepID=A0A428UP71_9HYPO|nr:hypothetical protein CDV31_004724 [Fusarium ambrosium]